MYAEQPRELPEELEERFAATFNRLCRVFRARGVPREESADLAQEAITRALMHLKRNGNHNENGTVFPLLNRIAANLLVDRIRAAGRRLVSLEAVSLLDEPDADPGEQLDRIHDRTEVRRAIGELTERHRRAIMLSLQGLSPADIAAVFGIERNAADALLHRARRRLADRLRNGQHALRAFPAIVFLKLRSSGRRAGRAARIADAGLIGAGQLGVNVVSGVLGVILVITPAGAMAFSSSAGAATPAAPRVNNISPVSGHLSHGARAGGAHDAPLALAVGARDQRASASARFGDPSGREHEAGVSVWHRRDADRGLTGPVLDQLVGSACDGVLSAACSVGGTQ